MEAQRSVNGIRLDGNAQYRVNGAGTRAVVVPETCRHGHRLTVVGYRITETDGVLRVRCDACAAAGETDHHWILRSSGPPANLAELDDAPYRALRE